MSNDNIFRILCEIYAKQEGLQVDAIWKGGKPGTKNDRPVLQHQTVG